MSVQSTIEQKLSSHIHAQHLEVINESDSHNVPRGSESHFKVIIVSDDFSEKKLIARHRMVNEVLKDELQGAVHALALHTYTAPEWAKKNNQAPASPQCRGGSKE